VVIYSVDREALTNAAKHGDGVHHAQDGVAGYNFVEPYLTYLVADAAGQLERTVPIALPAP